MKIFSFWKAVLRQDADAIRSYFHKDARINWHCTNESFSLEEYILANCEYPGAWDGEIERLEEVGDLFITVTRVFPQDKAVSFHVTSFFKIRDDKILSLDEYWADDGEAPRWRQNMHIGTPIH